MTPDSVLWLSALRAAGRSPRTIDNYRDTLARFERFTGRPAIEAQRLDVLRWVQSMQETLSAASVSHHYRGVRAFLGWAVREELIDKNPATNLRLSVPNTIKDTPTVEHVDAMLTAARGDRRASAILTVLADTGCRRGELAAVTRADVDLTSGVFCLPVSKTRARVVPLSDRALVALGRWMRHRHSVPALRAHPSLWSLDDPAQLIRRACSRYSRGTISAHALRRYFATQWLARGGSESSLIRLCGWTSGAMLRTYTAANADALALAEYRRLA